MLNNDSKKKDNEITFKRWVIQNLFSIAAIIVVLANVWLASKLYPISQSIQAIESQVFTNEDNIDSVWNELKYIRSRVDLIYTEIR